VCVSIPPTAKKTADPAASVAHVAVHAVVDAEGLPKAPKLTEGLAHDGRSASCSMRLSEGQTLLVNRAYRSDAPRQSLTKRGVAAFSKGAGADHRVMLRYSTGFQLGKHRIELAHHMAANGIVMSDELRFWGH
jgi:hypothetical protein